MLFSNLLELCLLAWLCFVHLMLFSVSDFLVLVASPECKIGLLHIMDIHIYKRDKNLSQGRPGTKANYFHNRPICKLYKPGQLSLKPRVTH